MANKGSRIQFGARLPPELIDDLREQAARNGRTLSAETELAVREYLEGQKAIELPPEIIRSIQEWMAKQEGQR